MDKIVDINYLVSHRKNYIGGYLIEHVNGAGYNTIYCAGKVQKIWMDDDDFEIITDSATLIRVPVDKALGETGIRITIMPGDNNMYIENLDAHICYTLIVKTEKAPPKQKQAKKEGEDEDHYETGPDDPNHVY